MSKDLGPSGPDSPLDPELEPDRWERLVTEINTRAEPLLQARRRERSLIGILSSWRMPVLSTSVGLAAAAVFALLLIPGSGQGPDDEVVLAEVVMPLSVANWIDGSYQPTMEELLEDLEGYVP